MSDSREALRSTFNTAAETYEAVRPGYPTELFDDLVELAGLTPGDRLLEIGCATGKATRPLLERGFSIVCVELGEQLARRARDALAGLPVEIEIAAFEDWQSEPGDEIEASVCSKTWPSGATSGRRTTQPRSTSPFSTPSPATSRWTRPKGNVSTERSANGSAAAASHSFGGTGKRSSTLHAARPDAPLKLPQDVRVYACFSSMLMMRIHPYQATAALPEVSVGSRRFDGCK
jgi:hypothetical protein